MIQAYIFHVNYYFTYIVLYIATISGESVYPSYKYFIIIIGYYNRALVRPSLPGPI